MKLLARANELGRPVPPPRVPSTFTEAMTLYQRNLTALKWNTIEVQFAAVELVRSHESVASFDATGITTSSGRRLTRLWLREVNAPVEQPWKDRFFASLPKLSNDQKLSGE